MSTRILGFLEESERDFIAFHIVFAIVCGSTLLIPLEIAIGIRMFVLVAIYNLSIPGIAFWRDYADWSDLWLFAIILSILQVIPDWFLAAQLEVLTFPADGFPKIGDVSGYMAGLWAIPLFSIVYLGQRVEERYSQNIAYLLVAIASLVIFGISEETMWALPAWSAQDVTKIGHVAVYIIIPEIMLGLTAFYGYKQTNESGLGTKAIVAFYVMLLYLGSACFFYFLIETVFLGN